jgi:tetraacyldisaccharide 4'-kinase
MCRDRAGSSYGNHDLNQEAYHNLISGRASERSAKLLRVLLTALSWPYALVVRLRNALYSSGLLRTHRANAAVISVGNLTTGGTGKTPLVVWLCQYTRQKGYRSAILTRGYKTQKEPMSDEPAVLAARCPDAQVIVNPDRVAGANEAINTYGAKVVILDDGFQHRRLGRDVDIVTVDATRPFGYNRLLPAGLLREPVTALRRAHAVVITRCDQVSRERLEQIEREIRRIHPQAVIATSTHVPVRAGSYGDPEIGLDELRGKKVFAFCGVGNPQAFFDTIREIGCSLRGTRRFDDHCRYTDTCLGELCRQADLCKVDFMVTTQKDWTKIAQLNRPAEGPPLAYLAIELQFRTGAEQLTALLDRAVDGTIANLQKSGN